MLGKTNRINILKITLSYILILLLHIIAQYGLLNIGSVFSQSYNLKDIIMYTVFSFCFIHLYNSPLKLIKYLSYIITFFTFSLYNGIGAITSLGKNFKKGLGFELSDANLLLMELPRSGSISEVFTAYSIPILYVIIESLILVIAIHFIVHFFAGRIHSKILSVTPFFVITVVYLLFGSGAAVYKMPVVYKVPFQFYRASSLDVYRGDRGRPLIDHDGKNRFKSIVYIVDESVRGDVLSINGFKQETTPFLKSMDKKLFNYGKALSASNCSASSNILLQTGVQPSENDNISNLGKLLFEGPNIFQYAQQAGYRTIYIDGQLKGGKLQNYMRSNDFDYLNDYIQVRKDESIERNKIDHQIAEIIKRQLSSDSLVFLYVIKSGTHFPYESCYPSDQKVFSPTSVVKIFENKEEIRNSYYNAVRWTVDQFFLKLQQSIENEDAIVVYTADHGQNLMDDDRLTGQCSNDIGHLSEVTVPLFVIANGTTINGFSDVVDDSFTYNYDKVSHFNLFPTLLYLQGYPANEIKKLYGKNIFEPLDGDRYYISSLVPGSGNTRLYISKQ